MSHDLIGQILIPLNPIGWKAPTAFPIRRGGKVSAGVAPATEVVAYQQAVREFLEEEWTPLPADFPVRLVWHFRRQQASYASEAGRTVTKHKQDLTNLIKSTEDALQPTVLKNDIWVVEMSAAVDQGKHITDPNIWLEVWDLR